MDVDFKEYLSEIKFEKWLKTIKKKAKGKKIIIYGAGSLFEFINKNYDLSDLNIIAISDMKFENAPENTEYLGYKAIAKDRITKYNPDYVLVSTLNYISIIEDFECNYFEGTKIKVRPLAKMPLLKLIKEIWSR